MENWNTETFESEYRRRVINVDLIFVTELKNVFDLLIRLDEAEQKRVFLVEASVPGLS